VGRRFAGAQCGCIASRARQSVGFLGDDGESEGVRRVGRPAGGAGGAVVQPEGMGGAGGATEPGSPDGQPELLGGAQSGKRWRFEGAGRLTPGGGINVGGRNSGPRLARAIAVLVLSPPAPAARAQPPAKQPPLPPPTDTTTVVEKPDEVPPQPEGTPPS